MTDDTLPPPPAEPDDDAPYVPSPFVVRARGAALLWPVVLVAVGLPGTRFLGGSEGRELGDVFLSAMALATGLPTLPLFAALPIGSGWIVLVLGASTSLPVWVWAGAGLARRVEHRHGPDWKRWASWYAAFPLVAAFAALVFVGGLLGN